MSQFEVITITLSFVLGLSMSHLLWAAAAAFAVVIVWASVFAWTGGSLSLLVP